MYVWNYRNYFDTVSSLMLPSSRASLVVPIESILQDNAAAAWWKWIISYWDRGALDMKADLGNWTHCSSGVVKKTMSRRGLRTCSRRYAVGQNYTVSSPSIYRCGWKTSAVMSLDPTRHNSHASSILRRVYGSARSCLQVWRNVKFFRMPLYDRSKGYCVIQVWSD